MASAKEAVEEGSSSAGVCARSVAATFSRLGEKSVALIKVTNINIAM